MEQTFFKYGVVSALSGALTFRLRLTAMLHFFVTVPQHYSGHPQESPLILALIPLSCIVLAVAGVIAMIVSLFIGNQKNRKTTKMW